MASGRIQFLTCSKCAITVRDSGTLNPSCYKCHTPLQANHIRKGRTDRGRSGQLGWSSRSSSSQENLDDLADGRTSDVESRTGGLGWKSRFSGEQTELPADERPASSAGVKDAGHLSQFESAVNSLAVRADRSLNMGISDSEPSRTRHGPRQSLFSSSQSVVSSEDTFDGDDTSSWNGDYPGSPHSAAYEPSISSEDGYLSRGVSRRTRKLRGPSRASKPVGESSFGSLDASSIDAASADVPQGRFVPPRPRGERFLSDTSGSLGGLSGNLSQGLHSSSSGSRELSGYNWAGEGIGDTLGHASSSSGSRDLSGYNWAGEGLGDTLGHASSSSGELGRPVGLRRNQYSSNNNQPAVKPRRSNAEANARMSIDGLREVNPYGLSPSSRSQASPASTRIPPPPSHYQPSPPASRSIHCCAHCRSETCRAFEQFGVDVCCVNGDCSTCSHTCCQPMSVSASGGQQCHGKPNPFIPESTSSQEHDGQALKAKEKKKRYVRPVFGGANFITCYECDELLQIPEDFHFSRTRRNKLRCGSCYKIIVYCLIDKTRIVPYKDAVNQKIMSSTGKVDGDGHRGANSHAATSSNARSNHSRADQISYNDNYSAYSDGAGSTEGEPDSLSKAALRKRQAAALHKLMGYFSARDIMYEAPRRLA